MSQESPASSAPRKMDSSGGRKNRRRQFVILFPVLLVILVNLARYYLMHIFEARYDPVRVVVQPAPDSELPPGKAGMDDTRTDFIRLTRRPDLAHWIGKPAPDFELPLLMQQANENGDKVAGMSREKIRLSSFRGKKVVCLFLSSYT